MNKTIKNRMIKFLLLLIILIIALGLSIEAKNKDKDLNIENICRVIVSEDLNHIRNNEIVEGKHEYTIFSLKGEVIKSTQEGTIKNYDPSYILDNNYSDIDENIEYATYLQKDGEVSSIIRFLIPKEEVESYYSSISIPIIFIIVFCILILLCIWRIYRIIKSDILNPVQELHTSARAILKGNLNERVKYDYYGEIGEFSRDFESMREELVLASKKAEEAKIAEKELLACISHDLKTPIANIMGYCEGINDGVVVKKEDIDRYIGIILKKARVLNKLLDDILDLAKAEINKMSINKKEIYTREFFSDILEEISIDVISKNRKFEFVGEIPNILLDMDEERVIQAINNIVNNSIKYTEDNGTITIFFNRIEDGIEVNIKDNGIGIASDEINLVFNKFYRSDKHRNQNIPGSGLGLSIAKYITKMHNGDIKIESSKGNYTLVTMQFRNSVV